MEKKTIRSGAPYVTAGLAVFAVALVLGIGSLLSYGIAAAAGTLGFLAGRRLFPDRVVEIERAPRSGNAEVDALIAEARGQLAAIAQANEAIAERELSAQIDDIEATCRTILQRLEEQPNMLSSLRTFLRYYLPTTRKILDNRALIEQRGTMDDENARAVCERTDRLLPEIRRAFQKQLDALNEHNYLDVEVEMDVLEGMMKGDGLAGGASAAATQTK